MADSAVRWQPPALAAASPDESAWMRVLPPASRIVIHGDATARSAIGRAFDVAFAEEACRALTRNGRTTLWLGPDEYLLIGALADTEPGVIARMREDLEGVAHALVDVSHRQFALEVRGPYAAVILNAGCPLDLDLSEFPVGMCTRTVFAKADIVLWRTGEDIFRVEVWRSFAGYVAGLLREIAREFMPVP